MTSTDVDYYRKRAAQEREAALDPCEHIAEIHLELARAYEALVEQGDLRDGMRLVA